MNDIKCPYCKAEQEICHDDGYGYEEDEVHQQECWACEKLFVYTTSISFYYQAYRADCLNGAEHKFRATTTYPIECTRMRCVDCDLERQPTEDEMKKILARKEVE